MFYPECCALIGCPVDLSYCAAERLVEGGKLLDTAWQDQADVCWTQVTSPLVILDTSSQVKETKKGKMAAEQKSGVFLSGGQEFQTAAGFIFSLCDGMLRSTLPLAKVKCDPKLHNWVHCAKVNVCVCTWLVYIHFWAKVFPREPLLSSLLPSLLPSLCRCYLLQTSLRFHLRVCFHGRHLS